MTARSPGVDMRPNLPSDGAGSGRILGSYDRPTARAATAPDPRHPSTGAGTPDAARNGDGGVPVALQAGDAQGLHHLPAELLHVLSEQRPRPDGSGQAAHRAVQPDVGAGELRPHDQGQDDQRRMPVLQVRGDRRLHQRRPVAERRGVRLGIPEVGQ